MDIGRALSTITQDYRVALVLADVQDLPYEEIAKVLDVPVGTVKSRVHRGRLALAIALGIDRPQAPVAGPREPPHDPGSSEESS
jgi:RNA polymerase sigma-70 factor, ECF subfamily